MAGSDSPLSDERAFLTAHRYDDVWGWDRSGGRTALEPPRKPSGRRDTDLVREAISHLHELDLQAPFGLTLLTHAPDTAAPDCPEYQPDQPVLNAVHCTDYAVGLLLDALREQGELDHTVVVMMGDRSGSPGIDQTQAAGLTAGWFGKVFMAVRTPRERPETNYAPAYTPDFAPIVLDALRFRHVSRFPLGRLPLGGGKPRKTLIGRQFEVIDDRTVPEHPTLSEPCSEPAAAQVVVAPNGGALGDCERKRIMDALDSALMNASPAGYGEE